MAVPASYLTSTKNLASIFEALRKAQVPDAFTYEFLKQLGYSSSSDRPVIPVLKAIGFLDSSGRPTPLYREYKDPKSSKSVLARALRKGYSDVFAIDAEAFERTTTELTGMFSRLSDKGESVTSKMALTFKSLSDMADFDAVAEPVHTYPREPDTTDPTPGPPSPGLANDGHSLTLRHDVHIHLPLSTDVAVYDAIFKSIKANLL
ncbi:MULTISPECIES: DUF5343 domain-containing protein [unclassified Aeromicrobium]|uniref:DUF5343 domain-containing protein n=1 Tax=unclassified Aeromicrobium TaxID=2633570 RepID=UPI00396B15BC